jgi:hypothetical protein
MLEQQGIELYFSPPNKIALSGDQLSAFSNQRPNNDIHRGREKQPRAINISQAVNGS